MSNRPLRILVWTAVVVLNQVLYLGYVGYGIVLMLAMHWYLNRRAGMSASGRWGSCLEIMLLYIPVAIVFEHILGVQLLGWDALSDLRTTVREQLFDVLPTLAAVPLMALYNGEYGHMPKWFRILYRDFYPAHLWILAAVIPV